MNSNHRMWARFRSENNGMTQISIVLVLFWDSEGDGNANFFYLSQSYKDFGIDNL